MKTRHYIILILFFIASPVFSQNNCLTFDGVNDKVSLTALGVSTTEGDKTTVEFWMFWDGTYGDFPFGFDTYDLWLYNGHFGFNTFNTDLYGINSNGLSNKWVHVAAIFNNGDVTGNKLYINGIEQILSQKDGTPTNNNAYVTTSATIGGHITDTWNYFKGEIDEFRIWNGERTTSQIRENMCRELGNPGGEANLVAYYNMNTLQGTTTLPENSGNSNDGYSSLFYSGSVDVIESPSAFTDEDANWIANEWVGKTLTITTSGEYQERIVRDNVSNTVRVTLDFNPNLVTGENYVIVGDALILEDSEAFTTWTGNSSTDWSTASNWTDGVPTSTDNVGIPSSGTNPTLSGSPTVNNLVLGTSSALTLSSGVTVNGNLFLESNLDLNGQIIYLGSTGLLVEGAGRLHGVSGAITTTRDLNNINQNVAGLGAEIQTAANMGSTIITRGHSASFNSIYRYYDISPSNNILLDGATLVFHYNDNELNGLTESNLGLFKSKDAINWTVENGTLDTENNTITLAGINSFSLWTAGDRNQPLPVELTSFTAALKSSATGEPNVILNWATATEVNNYGFEIESQILKQASQPTRQVQNDNDQWEIIGFVEGHGNSISPKEYTFTDKAHEAGKYTYRLKQIDFDGKFEYSDVVEVNVESIKDFSLDQNFPNPFNPSTMIKYSIPTKEFVSLKIYDILGNEVVDLVNENKEAGNYEVSFDASNYPSGLYIYSISAGSFNQVRKMMLVK